MLYELYYVKGNPPPSPDGFTFDLQRFASAFGGGSGTEADPYKISTVAHLQQLATDVNGGTTYEGVYFKLTANIDLSSVNNWTQIGCYDDTNWVGYYFKGTFDGDNKIISKLTINKPNDYYVGLFGCVGVGGTIKNVKLNNVDVTSNDYVGGLVGYNEGGTIENCTVSGKVTGTVSYSYVGGLVGENEGGTVKGNTAISNVSGTDEDYVGGLVGYNNGGGTVSGNKYYSNKGDVGSNKGGTVSGNTQLYLLTLPEGVTATGDSVVTVDGKTYAVGEVTLKATDTSKVLNNITVNGTSDDDGVFTISADTTITADIVTATFDDVFSNGGKSVVVGGTTGDFSANNGVYSITASQQNSTLVGNAKNNTVVLTGGGENILTGGGGNDTYKFEAGGGIVKDFGIGATKDKDGKALDTPLGSDVIKIDGKVSGVYFDRDASSKKSATFTAVITYGTGDDTQIIVLKDINKKPTKYGSNPVYQTNDAAAATLKIWDTNSGSSKVLSATKLKALFRDDSELDTLGDLVKSKITYLGELADGKTPTTNPFEQTAQATFSGSND